jgi:hypothetical protein
MDSISVSHVGIVQPFAIWNFTSIFVVKEEDFNLTISYLARHRRLDKPNNEIWNISPW